METATATAFALALTVGHMVTVLMVLVSATLDTVEASVALQTTVLEWLLRATAVMATVPHLEDLRMTRRVLLRARMVTQCLRALLSLLATPGNSHQT